MKLGSTSIDKVMLGSTEVDKIYVGSTQVWPTGYTPPTYTTSGIIAYYDPANPSSYSGSGSTLVDLSGNSNNGTIVGATFTDNSYFTLDGTNDYIATPNLYTTTDRSHTVEMWVYANAVDDCLWSEANTNNPATAVYHYAGSQILQVGPFQQIIGGIWNGVNGIQRAVGASGTLTGAWKHVVKTYDQSTTTITAYVNASTGGSATYEHFASWDLGNGNNEYYLFGAEDTTTYSGSTAGWLSGRVGIMRVYNRALSGAEVTSNYNGAKSIYGL